MTKERKYQIEYAFVPEGFEKGLDKKISKIVGTSKGLNCATIMYPSEQELLAHLNAVVPKIHQDAIAGSVCRGGEKEDYSHFIFKYNRGSEENRAGISYLYRNDNQSVYIADMILTSKRINTEAVTLLNKLLETAITVKKIKKKFWHF
jgi:hypothetical protein